MGKPNHITVEVAEIRGPNHFWVVPHDEGKEYTKQMINLRKEMRIHYESQFSADHDDTIEYRKNDIVAVKLKRSSKLWERAKIENISEAGFGEPRFVEVFLLDRGKRLKIIDISSNLRPILNSSWLHIEAQAKELVLAGLTPISKDFNYLELKMKSIVSTKWSELAYLLVKDFLEISEDIYVEVKAREDIDEKKMLKRIYGHMILNLDIDKPEKLQQLIDKYANKKVHLKKYFQLTDIELVSVRQLLLKGRFCIERNDEQMLHRLTVNNQAENGNIIRKMVSKEKTKSLTVEGIKNVNESQIIRSNTELNPTESSTYSSTERLLRWPQLEKFNENGIPSKLTYEKRAETSAAYTSSTERLMKWPLGEQSLQQKQNNLLSTSQNDDTNGSGSYQTAEGSISIHEQSSIVAGNLTFEYDDKSLSKSSKGKSNCLPVDVDSRNTSQHPVAYEVQKTSEIHKIDIPEIQPHITESVTSPKQNQIRFNCQSSRFVLCHGDKGSRRIKPVLSIDGFPKTFDKKLKQILLSNKIDMATKLQEYMWPVVSKTYSVVSIGPKGSGKTYGYLIPVIDMIIKAIDESRVKLKKINNTAPLAVILCPSWKVVIQVENILKTIERELKALSDRSSIAGQTLRILAIYEGEKKLKHNVAIINGCHILITTPPSLLRMMKSVEAKDDQDKMMGTNLKMCNHLIFENADESFEKFNTEINTLMEMYKTSRANERERLDKIKPSSSIEMFDQLIITSRKWANSLEQFIKVFIEGEDKVGPYFLFCDYLEAAIYGKSKIASYMVDDVACKYQKVKEIIYGISLKQSNKILIHVNQEKMITELCRFLEQDSPSHPKIVPFYLPQGETSAIQTREILSIWRQTSESNNLNEYYPLIVSDSQDVEPLDLFRMTDNLSDDMMIMFDLPENSKKSFAQRFSHVSNAFRSFYENDLACEDRPIHCHILITPQDRDKMKSVYMFLKSISYHSTNNLSLPLSLTNVYRAFQEEDARKKATEDLCSSIKLFGRCNEKRTCGFRHFIVPKYDFEDSVIAQESVVRNDFPESISDSASIMEYQVITVFSASHFYVRLKKSKTDVGKVIRDFGKSYIRLGMKLACLEESELEIIHLDELKDLARTELILVREKQEFKRAKILSKAHKNIPSKYILVDEGKLLTISKTTQFWKLPSQLKNTERYPLHAAELVLIGVVPCDKNTEWPELPCKIIHKGVLAMHRRNRLDDTFSSDETDEIADFAEMPEERDTICRSKFALILANTIWAKQVQLLEKLRSHDIDADGKVTYHYSSNWTPIFEVKERLIRKGLADENSRHISYLLDICKPANLPAEVEEKLVSFLSDTTNPNTSISASSKSEVRPDNISVNATNKPEEMKNSNSGFTCPIEVRKLYQNSLADVINSHQVAHLKLDPEIEEVSDSGLPNEEELKKHSEVMNLSTTELLTRFKYMKLQKCIENNSDNTVILSYAYDPSCFYLRIAKFAKQLIALEKDIYEYAEQAKVMHSGSNLEFEEGRLCIGRLLIGFNQDSGIYSSVNTEIQSGKDTFEYKRVQILRHATEEDEAFERDPMENFRYLDSGDENDEHLVEDDIHIKTPKYTVFFVDYGYQKILSMHDLLPLPKKFVERLPLQAIGCSLSNIVPSAEDDSPWSDDAIEFFNQFASISDSFSDGDRRFITAKSMLLLKAIGATKCEGYEETSEPNNWPIRYWTRLVPKEGGDHLGMQLVKKGYAEHIDSEIMLSYNESQWKTFNSTKEADNTNEPIENNISNEMKMSDFKPKPVKNTNIRDNVPIATVNPVIKSTVTVPSELPGLCISKDYDNNVTINLRPQLVTWSQNKEKTHVAFRFQLDLIYSQETCLNNTYLSIESRSLAFEYLEIGHVTEKSEKYRHHSIPNIDLFGAVDPHDSEVKFSGKEILVKLRKVNSCFWQYPVIDSVTGKGKRLAWMKLDNDIGWPGSSDSEDTDSENNRLKPQTLKKRSSSKIASTIRYTLDQYPKPVSSNYEAKNFDDSTDGVDDFMLADRNNHKINSEDSDNDGLETMNMNQVGIKRLYMNPRKAPVIYDPDTSNYID